MKTQIFLRPEFLIILWPAGIDLPADRPLKKEANIEEIDQDIFAVIHEIVYRSFEEQS